MSLILAGLLFVFAQLAAAQDAAPVTPAQIKLGSETYSRHCAACHGVRMKNPEGATDLLAFAPDQRERFINSVTRGRNSMPPFGGLLPPEDIAALWAYVAAGDKN